MLREGLQKQFGRNTGFRYRGAEPGRLENFSDAVFALAITLLLISTSPPANFAQIKRFTYDLLPFLACITLIILIWHEHFLFYLRYGIRDNKMIVLNTLFLVIVLFYVYPLKFLTKIIILFPVAWALNEQSILNEMSGMIRAEDMGQLMIIYGFGATCVFLVLMQMYRYALKKADELDLSELERFDTRTSIRTNLFMALVPFVSVILAFLLRHSWLAGPIAGFIYFLYTPIMFIHGTRSDKKRKQLLATLPDSQQLVA
ncbi:MAG: TMEM175 family protein [Bacteroidota bacterium]